MSETLYDVIFNFGFKNATSDDYVIFQALSEDSVRALLDKLAEYGQVPKYSFYSPTTDYNIYPDRVADAYLIFRITYSSTMKYSVEEMVSKLNQTMVDFIRSETKVEGFL
jgi:hypothetical protein